ncbi:MAG: hypothetical protein MZV49_05585 [Rhodopseudomonas palustris]|nr:hypothetical protein [Rhodopseudomonas palustris]
MLPVLRALEHDCGIAQAALVHGARLAGGLCRAADDFAQDVGLGKALRADIQDWRGARRAREVRADHSDKQQFHPPGLSRNHGLV